MTKTTIFLTIPKDAFEEDAIVLSPDMVIELEKLLAFTKSHCDGRYEDIEVIITHKERQCIYKDEMGKDGPLLVEDLL